MTTHDLPTTGADERPGRRVPEVDTIRGFALAGILLANLGFFADPRQLATVGVGPSNPVDLALQILVLSKFYIIFSFLFGYSFTLQTRSGRPGTVARTVRRCLGLFVLGLLHGLLLWPGDILTLYAALGLLLLLVRRIRPRTAVIAGIVLLTLVTVAYALLAGLITLSPEPVSVMTPYGPEAGARLLAEYTAGPLDAVGVNVAQYPGVVASIWFAQGPTAMAMFLLGFAAGTSRLFERPADWAHRMTAVQWIGFGIGLPAAVLSGVLFDRNGAATVASMALTTATAPLLAAAYVVTLLRLARRLPVVPALLNPAGRIAASNYLGQSVLAFLIFSGCGLGLAGRVSPLATVGIAVLVFGLLVTLSAWWLRGHRYGPIEYGLRRLTHWRRPS
ncbi:DUF418 domain-containing protein [Nonomuraea sp. NN258]|uniref:DUF418 domain-containing protein n=1 Tax=Nonomuraea antri TaxID=2730852 RepID=UPI001568EC0B|nr:DUF418 domain-containing protein [Nonomuraea antri]NRQ37304.1 DUF418 domain-containing protein [Nonomuraea antri]